MTKWISVQEASKLVKKSEAYLRKHLIKPDSPFKGNKIPWGDRYKWEIDKDSLLAHFSGSSSSRYEDVKNAYLDEMRGGGRWGRPLTEKYIDDIDKSLTRFWDVLGQQSTVEAVNADNLKIVLASFELDHENKKDWHSTKSHIYKAVTGFCQKAIEMGTKAENDLLEIRKYRPKKTFKLKKRVYDAHHIPLILAENEAWSRGRAAYDRELNHILISLYAYAGLRRMEAASLRIRDLYLSDGYLIAFGKNKEERYVPIFPELATALNRWFPYRGERNPESQWVIPAQDGGKLTQVSISNRFRRLNNARLKDLNMVVWPHDLRRTFARVALLHGLEEWKIQLILGHKDMKTTRGYTMPDTKDVLASIMEGKLTHRMPTPEPVVKHDTPRIELPPLRF